jgi:hypothetical protein
MVALLHQVIPKYFVYETFFSLAFHMNQEAGHRC